MDSVTRFDKRLIAETAMRDNGRLFDRNSDFAIIGIGLFKLVKSVSLSTIAIASFPTLSAWK